MAPAVAEPVSITGIFMQVIPLTQLKPSPLNPRKHFDQAALEDLARTMGNGVGVIEPLVVRMVNGALFEIVAGERRWRAAKIAQLEAVPVVIKELTDMQVLELMVIENDAREDLNPLEEADGFKRLVKFGFDIDKLAARIGHTRKYVYDRMKLLELIPAAQQLLLENEMTAAHAVLIARLPAEQQKRVIDPRQGGLFDYEDAHGLWRPDEKHEGPARRKAATVRELEGWINDHCRLDLTSKQLPELFPDTADVVEAAETVVHLTFAHYMPDNDVTKGQEKIYLYETDWKRADGKKGSKVCPKAVTGVIVVGAGRSEAFKVCIDKACTVHWPKPKPVAHSTPTRPSHVDSDWHKRQQKEQQARRRFKAALPRIVDACVERLVSARSSVTVDIAARGFKQDHLKEARKRIPVKSIEDTLRVFALAELLEVANDYNAEREIPKLAKTFGLNIAPLLKPAKAAKSTAQISTGPDKGKKKAAAPRKAVSARMKKYWADRQAKKR